MDEAIRSLEEFGYFKVLDAQNVTTDEQKEEFIADWRKYRQEEYERVMKSLPTSVPALPEPDLSRVPENLAYCYGIIARREIDAT